VNDGASISLSTGGAMTGIPIGFKNVPEVGAGNGVGAFTFRLNWNKDVIRVDSVTGATIDAWTMIPGTPDNTAGTVIIAGLTGSNYLTADTVVGTVNITALGAAGTSTTLAVTIESFGDKNGVGIPANPLNAQVQIVNVVAETSLALARESDGVAVVNVIVNRGKNPATGATADIPGGIASFSATAGRTPAGGIEFLGVREAAPYLGPTINTTTGVFGVASVAAPTQPNNSTLAKLVPKLVGNCVTTYTLNVSFQQIIAVTGGANVPEDSAESLTFRRGDAQANGTVNIFDAMYIAQYIVGNRPISDLNYTNAACVKHDATSGDKLDIFDAMYIAQMVVGTRDGGFQALP